MAKRTLVDWMLARPAKPEEGEVMYARFNDRLFANVIDLFFLYILMWPVLEFLNPVFYGGMDPKYIWSQTLELARQQGSNVATEYLTASGMIDRWLLVNFLHILVLAIPYLFFWIKFQATPGKMVLGLRIVDANTGKAPSAFQMIERYGGLLLSMPPLALGYIWMHFTKKNQTWHDKFAGTAVVYTEYSYIRLLARGWEWLKAKIKNLFKRSDLES